MVQRVPDSFAAQRASSVVVSLTSLGLVGLGVDLQLDQVRRPARARLGDDDGGLACGHLAVHDGGADADALLPAALLEAVELGAVQELAEDLTELRLEDARPVVLDGDRVLVVTEVVDGDLDVREDLRLLASVEGVVHGLAHGGEQRLGGVVEAEQVAVLGEELADGDVALPRGHAGRVFFCLLGRHVEAPLCRAPCCRGNCRQKALGPLEGTEHRFGIFCADRVSSVTA
jgi:hypothetical protein